MNFPYTKAQLNSISGSNERNLINAKTLANQMARTTIQNAIVKPSVKTYTYPIPSSLSSYSSNISNSLRSNYFTDTAVLITATSSNVTINWT